MSDTSTHIGRKISRIRELRGMKQDTLAAELGVSQQAISKMEQSEKIEDEALERVATVLGVPAEGIKQFSDEAVMSFIASSYDNAASIAQYYNFNPIEKIVALYDEKVQLLERLLASEREKVDLLPEKGMK